jgi:tripartite-type tricarboxylate transporter receptor subunit TctC
MYRKTGIAVAMATALSLLAGSTATAADDFFKGKTIRVIVGYAPGGGYDTYTRQIVRHMGKYIPGNPTFVVQNMTGAGSLIAANYTQKRAKRDGTVLGVWNSGFVTMQALGDKKVQIKAKELGWLGAPVKGDPTCAFMGWSGLTNVKQLMDPNKPVKVGGTRTGSTGVDLPKVLNKTIKTNFDVVAGYSGTATTRLAMQAEEVAGSCWGWESMRVTAKAMLDAKGPEKLVPLLVHKKIDDPELKNAVVIPELIEKVGGKKHLGTYQAWVGQYEFQRPMVAPPGLPTERLQTLRRAFKRTLEDPEFLKEANEAKLIVDYVSPGDIDQYVKQILGMSPQTKEALGFLVRKKGSS